MESMQFGRHRLPLNYEELTQAFNLGEDQQLVVVDKRQDNRIYINNLRNEIVIPVDMQAIRDAIRQLHAMIHAGKVQVLQKNVVDGQENLSLHVSRLEMERELEGATFIRDGVEIVGKISVTYDARLKDQLETAMTAHSVALNLLFSEAQPTPQTEEASTAGATIFQHPDTESTRAQRRSPESDPQQKSASVITQAQIARINREKIEKSKLQKAEDERQSQRDIEKIERMKDKEKARETARAATGLGSSDPIPSDDPIAKENAHKGIVGKAQEQARQKKTE